MPKKSMITMPIRITMIIFGFVILIFLYFVSLDAWYPLRFSLIGEDVSRYVYAAALICVGLLASMVFRSGLAGRWEKVIG